MGDIAIPDLKEYQVMLLNHMTAYNKSFCLPPSFKNYTFIDVPPTGIYHITLAAINGVGRSCNTTIVGLLLKEN